MTNPVVDPIRLTSLKSQQAAIIDSIEGTDALSVRLMEMGLIAGETITLIGAAPLGDPLEFQIHGYRISLRRQEADRVLVVPLKS